jgi:hypothetical protein
MDAGIVAPLESALRHSRKGSKATVQESDEGNSFPDRRRSSFLRQHVDTGSELHSAVQWVLKLKQNKLEAGHSSPFGADIKKCTQLTSSLIRLHMLVHI